MYIFSIVLFIQDTMDSMYKSSSAAERGTLYHIRNRFHRRSVKKNVMESVEHVEDLLDLTTDGGICLLALKLLNANTTEDVKVPESVDAATFITQLAAQIVNHVWPYIDDESIRRICDDVVVASDRGDDDDGDDDDDEGRLFCTCKSTLIDGIVHFNDFLLDFNRKQGLLYVFVCICVCVNMSICFCICTL